MDNSPTFGDLKFSTLSANLLLQPFIPIVSFPTYFEPLYKFVYKLEQLCRDCSFGSRDLRKMVIPRDQGSDLNCIISFISDHLESILAVVNNEGFTLLLLHIYPLFQSPETSFESICSFLNPLAQRMSKKNIDRLFSAPVIHLFDSPIEPYQRAQLLSRPMADMLIKRFGLSLFLSRLISFIIEAVIEPSRVASKGPTRKNSSRHKAESVLTLVQSDFLQSSGRLEELGKASEFTFSLALSEGGMYDLDKDECSSVDSDLDDAPEKSLLAQPRMVLSSIVGTSDVESQEEMGGGRGESPTKPWDQFFDQTGPKSEKLIGEGTLEHSSLGVLGTKRAHPDDPRLTSSVPLDRDASLKLDTSLTDYNPSSPSPQTGGSVTQSFGLSMTDSIASAQLYSGEVAKSLPASGHTPFNNLSGIRRQVSLPVGRRPLGITVDDILNADEDESEEDEQVLEAESICSADPETMAINSHMSQVAADCVCWLIRRLGPVLTTRYIAKPLLESLYHCFTGILHLRGRGTMALKCLSAIARLYGDAIILRLYLPHAENLVS